MTKYNLTMTAQYMKEKFQKFILKFLHLFLLFLINLFGLVLLSSQSFWTISKYLLRFLLNINIAPTVNFIGDHLFSDFNNRSSLITLGLIALGFSFIFFIVYNLIKNVFAETIIAVSLILLNILAGVILLFYGTFWPISQAIFIVLGTYIATLLYRYLEKIAQIYYLKNVFGIYVNQHILDDYINHPENLKISGEVKTVTVMFTDIRGFTSITEDMNPNQLMNFLHKYTSLQSEIIIKNDGVIDKYIGDSIMALWNATKNDENHGSKAVSSAFEMVKKINEFNFKKHGIPKIQIGVGVSTGDTVVGNVGSSQKINYTVIGDNVNLASRIENLTKKYGVPILVSDRTAGECTNLKDLIFREVDKVMVKGKKQSVSIFEPLENNSKNLDLKHEYENALRKYYKGDFERALEIFGKIENHDEPSKVLAERCTDLLKQRTEEWSGVWEWKDK